MHLLILFTDIISFHFKHAPLWGVVALFSISHHHHSTHGGTIWSTAYAHISLSNSISLVYIPLW